jgi:hypothetical protein
MTWRMIVLAAVVLLRGLDTARADFVTVTAGPNYRTSEFSDANFPAFDQAFNDANNATTTAHAFAFGSFNAASAAFINAQYTVGPNSFTATIGMSGTMNASNSAPGSSAEVVAQSSSGLTFVLSHPAIATMTYSPTLTLAPSSLSAPGPSSFAFQGTLSYLDLSGQNGSFLQVEGSLFQEVTSSGFHPVTSALTASSDTGGLHPISTSINGDSISLVLAPGTYNVFGFGQATSDFNNGAVGTYGVPPSPMYAGTSVLTVDSVPEPGSLTLLGIGVVGIVGVTVRRGRR